MRISPRFRRTVATVLLHSYAALLLLLALHHHHHGSVGAPTVGAVPQPAPAHVHLAADCPLLYYAVTAFQALPDRPAQRDLNNLIVRLAPERPVMDDRGAVDFSRSRAPPLLA